MFDDLFTRKGKEWIPNRSASPQLFSVFLDASKSVIGNGSMAFAFDLTIPVPDYSVRNIFWKKQHYEGSYLYRELILVEATPNTASPLGYDIKYGLQSETPNVASEPAKTSALTKGQGIQFLIPVKSTGNTPPGIKGNLRLEIRTWN